MRILGEPTIMRPFLSGKVSVIIPTYNHGHFIAEAIASVLKQTYDNIEVIIIDNYSTDNTEKIVSDFLKDNRVKYYQFDNKGVIAKARNFGIAKSTGEYIAFLDADDIWKEDKLTIQLKYFNVEIKGIATQFLPIGDTQSCHNHLDKLLGSNDYKDFSYKDILLQNPIMTSSLLMRREDFDKVGRFDESVDFRFIEDWELWLRLSKLGKIRVLALPLLEYRVELKNGRDCRDVAKRLLLVIDKHQYLGKGNFWNTRIARGNCYATIGKAYLDAGDCRGLIYYLRSLSGISGVIAKKRSVAGLLLYLIPLRIRKRIEKFFKCWFLKNIHLK